MFVRYVRYIQICLRTVSPQLLSALQCSPPILASIARLLQNFITMSHPRSNSDNSLLRIASISESPDPYIQREPRDPQTSSGRPPEGQQLCLLADYTLLLLFPLVCFFLLARRAELETKLIETQIAIHLEPKPWDENALDQNVRTHSDKVPVSSLQDRSLCPRSSLWSLECISSRFWMQRFSCQYTFSFPQSGSLHEHLRDVICACTISCNILSHLFRLVSYMNIYGM